MKEWTIDTCVLYRAADVDGNAIEFMNKVVRMQHIVALDNEGAIESEYRRCLERTTNANKPGGEYLRLWFKNCVNKFFRKYSGRLTNRVKRELNKMGFDNDDLPFVGVCSNTQSKKLVSEDSDYTPEIRTYLEEKLNIKVLSIIESLNESE